MAKKTTRRARPQSTPLAKTGDYRRQPVQPYTPLGAGALPSEPGRERVAPSQPLPKKAVDFAAEYHYVLGDLGRMAIIAAGMFAVLILLSFVIR